MYKSDKKNLGKACLLGALLGLLVLFTGCAAYSEKDLSPKDPSNLDLVTIEIPSGSSFTKGMQLLEENKLIKSAKALIAYGKEKELTNIKAGLYRFSPAMSAKEILQDLIEGKVYRGIKITIPEGWEARQIGDKLAEEGLVHLEEFMNLVHEPGLFSEQFNFLKGPEVQSLEGFLFPTTYYFFENTGADEILRVMLSRFDQVYAAKIAPATTKKDRSIYQIVTLAAVIEKEVPNDKERGLVASVFYNRLAKNMKLQSDATVNYALPERKVRLSLQDIKIDSPYNTYKYPGLPAGPVASPGEASLLAAAAPPDSDYLYFLAKMDGSNESVFTTNYEDHKKMKAKYLDGK